MTDTLAADAPDLTWYRPAKVHNDANKLTRSYP